MRNDLKIRTLTERFFEGETSLAEEQELYRLFREVDVPEDLQPYKEMFAGFEDISLPQQKPSRRRWGKVIGIAASVAVLRGEMYRQDHRNATDGISAQRHGRHRYRG